MSGQGGVGIGCVLAWDVTPSPSDVARISGAIEIALLNAIALRFPSLARGKSTL